MNVSLIPAILLALNVLPKSAVLPATTVSHSSIPEDYDRGPTFLLEKPFHNFFPRQDLMDFFSERNANGRYGADRFSWEAHVFPSRQFTFDWFVDNEYPVVIGPGKDFMSTGFKIVFRRK